MLEETAPNEPSAVVEEQLADKVSEEHLDAVKEKVSDPTINPPTLHTIVRHSSLPDVSSSNSESPPLRLEKFAVDIQRNAIIANMDTSVLGINCNDPQSTPDDDTDSKCDEVGARAKLLDSGHRDEDKMPKESSSASVANDEIWHLNDSDHKNQVLVNAQSMSFGCLIS